VDWGVYDGQVRPGALEAVDRAFAAVRGAVVDDQKAALSSVVGVFGHELIDKLIERLDAVFGGAAVEDLRALGVPTCEVAQGAPVEVRRGVTCNTSTPG
jgi:hypothetical protein